jgi:hypothetical protein
MKRTIRAANREVHLEEIEDVLAFRAGERPDDGEAVAPEKLSSRPQDARALRESGLRLVHSPRARWKERQRGRVLHAPGGDLLVASGEVVVGFRRDVPDSDALGLLAAFGARRAGRLARTFRIDTDSPFDAVDRLLGVPGMEYAEPVLLQRFETATRPTTPSSTSSGNGRGWRRRPRGR